MTALLGPHAGYIVACYAAAAAVVLGLTLWALAADRGASRALAELEGRRRDGGAP